MQQGVTSVSFFLERGEGGDRIKMGEALRRVFLTSVPLRRSPGRVFLITATWRKAWGTGMFLIFE